MADSLLYLNVFCGVHAVEPVPREMTLEQLATFLAHQEPPVIMRDERKLKELFSMNIYKPYSSRGKQNVESMTGIVFDFDNKEYFVPIASVTQRLEQRQVAHFWYTTHSHTTDRPKWRLIIPFATPLPVTEWSTFYQQALFLLGNPPGIDHPSCKDVARIWYPPYRNADQPYAAKACIDLFLIEPLDLHLLLTPDEQEQFRIQKEEHHKAASHELSSLQQKSGFTLGQALHVVSYLDAGCDYDQWLKVGMALHHQFNAGKAAFKIWDAWSIQSEKYQGQNDLVSHWMSFADKEKSVGIGTLIRMAKEKGYDPLREKEKIHLRLSAPDLLDFLALEIPPLEMLIDPIIPEQGLVMLYAPRGIGKTYLSLSIAYIAAAGQNMLNGKWKAVQENRILFVDGEMPAGRLQYRMKGIVRSMGPLSQERLFRIITPDLQEMGVPDLSKTEGQTLIEEHLKGVKLLILDNLSSLFRNGFSIFAGGAFPSFWFIMPIRMVHSEERPRKKICWIRSFL